MRRVQLMATREHAAMLAPVMRAADLAECLAEGFPDALAAIEHSLKSSDMAYSIFFGDQIAAMVGTCPGFGGQAVVWCLTGRAVEDNKLGFMRESRRLLPILHRLHDNLFNIVDARYQSALDWLECLGFTIGEAFPHPTSGVPFRVCRHRSA